MILLISVSNKLIGRRVNGVYQRLSVGTLIETRRLIHGDVSKANLVRKLPRRRLYAHVESEKTEKTTAVDLIDFIGIQDLAKNIRLVNENVLLNSKFHFHVISNPYSPSVSVPKSCVSSCHISCDPCNDTPAHKAA